MQLSVFGQKEALRNIKTLRVDANMAVTETFAKFFGNLKTESRRRDYVN